MVDNWEKGIKEQTERYEANDKVCYDNHKLGWTQLSWIASFVMQGISLLSDCFYLLCECSLLKLILYCNLSAWNYMTRFNEQWLSLMVRLLNFLRPTFRRIIRNESTEQFSGLPYIYTLLNCLITAWYGLPVVSNDNLLVTTVNSIGGVFQLVYITIFIIYADKNRKVIDSSLLALTVFIFFYPLWEIGVDSWTIPWSVIGFPYSSRC